jgi:CheY-like chemotaxis protein
MKAFLIDDDEFILDLYERVFKMEQHEVMKAHDGSEAWTVLEQANPLPDVIISDVVMPHMDGYELVAKIKSDTRFSEIPVIFLSNLYKREDRQKGLDLGARYFLVKSEHDPKEVLTHALEVIAS